MGLIHVHLLPLCCGGVFINKYNVLHTSNPRILTGL
jgi:hypothetical protein